MSVVMVALIVAQLALPLAALVVLLRTPAENLRHVGRPMWLAVILFLSFIGPLAFLILGRRRAAPVGPTPPGASGSAELLRELYARRTP